MNVEEAELFCQCEGWSRFRVGVSTIWGWHKPEVKPWLCSRFEEYGFFAFDFNEARISCQKTSASNVVKCISRIAKE